MVQFQKNSLRVLIFSLLAITCMMAKAASLAAGDWTTIDDKSGKPKSIVRLSVSGSELNGKIIKIYKENVSNPDETTCSKCSGALKDQPLIGLRIVQGLKENADGSWSGGTITDPESGSVYKCIITPSADGKTLDVRGYVGVSLLGRTQTWQKAN